MKKINEIQKQKNFISVVVYLHNNEGNILDFLGTNFSYLSMHFPWVEIICVDDASTDNTVDIIREYSTSSSCDGRSLSILEMNCQQGMESCMNAGIDLSVGDFVCTVENIDLFPTMDDLINAYNLCLNGNDIILLSSVKPESMSNKFYQAFYAWAFPALEMYSDTITGSILSRRAINHVQSMFPVIAYRQLAYKRSGLNVYKYRYKLIPEQKGHKIQELHTTDSWLDAMILCTDAPMKISKKIILFLASLFLAEIVYLLGMMIYDVKADVGILLFLSLMICTLTVICILILLVKQLTLISSNTFVKGKYTIKKIDKLF